MDFYKMVEGMQDSEIEKLMNLLVPGSTVKRVERLNKKTAINVYLMKAPLNQETMITFSDNGIKNMPGTLDIEAVALYFIYNRIKGVNHTGDSPVVSVKGLMERQGVREVLEQIVGYHENQVLESGKLKDMCEECGQIWDKLFAFCIESSKDVEAYAVSLEDLDCKILKEMRHYFYAQGVSDVISIFNEISENSPDFLGGVGD